MDKSALQAAIRAAFEDVPYPGDDNIGIKNSVGGNDAEQVSEGFRGVDWRTLTEEPDLWGLGLNFMTDEAAHYYLPAYLLVGIENPVREAMTGAMLVLDPYFGSGSYFYQERVERCSQFASLLSPSQKKVIGDALAYALSARVEYLVKVRESGPELDEGQSLDDVTEEEREEQRAWWDEEIEETRARYVPLIQYWSRA